MRARGRPPLMQVLLRCGIVRIDKLWVICYWTCRIVLLLHSLSYRLGATLLSLGGVIVVTVATFVFRFFLQRSDENQVNMSGF